jgi:hypothetical protein
MNGRNTLLATLALGMLMMGCSSSAASEDPTSVAALNKAPPMKWGSTCDQQTYHSYGDLHGSSSTPACLEGEDCHDYGGTDAFGYYYASGISYFEGTCNDPHPVTCDQRVPKTDCDACKYEKCCTYVALCEDDPNCLAIQACVAHCNGVYECNHVCYTNGEYSASAHYRNARDCFGSVCRDRC